MRLTDIVIKNLPPPQSGQKSYAADTVTGLQLRVSHGGTKSFCLLLGDSRQRVTIGRYPIIGLAEARVEARRILAERTLGKRQNPRVTFLAALETFLSTHVAEKNRKSTAGETTRILRKQFVALHRKQLADITTDEVMRIAEKMLSTGHPSAANHAFTAARAFFRWCVRRRYIPHSPLEGLSRPAEAQPRERTLTDGEIRAVWNAAGNDRTYGAIVKLLILTGQRRGEIASLKGEWCPRPPSKAGAGTPNQAEAAICLPATITKNKRSHTFPIGAVACELLNGLPRTGYLFRARGSDPENPKPLNGWNKRKAGLDRSIAVTSGSEDEPIPIPPWTLHDLRRTYATNLQRLGVKLEVIEALLNHVSGTRSGIVGVYQRHTYEAEMRAAVETFEAWFRHTILAGGGLSKEE